MGTKTAYVCGALTELPLDQQELVKAFYEAIGDLVGQLTGTRAFVPHEHFDPVKYASVLPVEVDRAEREQVCHKTSVLIVVALAPSWGGGIEVEMAYRSGVPIIILYPAEHRVSRLLRGNPGVEILLSYYSVEHALAEIRAIFNTHPGFFSGTMRRANGCGGILEVTQQVGLSH
jgi:hypothetical protein